MYQPLNIVIREAKLTDFVTDLSVIFNTNDSKLKSEIEKIVNGLQINTTTGVIGDPDSANAIPITRINTKTLDVITTTVEEWKLGFRTTVLGTNVSGVKYETGAIQPYSVSNPTGSLYVLTAGTAAAGYIGKFNGLTVDYLLQAAHGKFTTVDISSGGLFNCSSVAQFNDLVIHTAGHKESVADGTAVLMKQEGTSTVYYTDSYTISKSTPENIFVYLKVPAEVYAASTWQPSITALEIRLVLNPAVAATLPLSGQSFNIILRGIVDSAGEPITTHPAIPIVVKAMQTVTGTDDFMFKNCGNNGANIAVTSIDFVPKASDVATDSLSTFGRNLSMIYNKEIAPASSIYAASNHMMYVRNDYSKV